MIIQNADGGKGDVEQDDPVVVAGEDGVSGNVVVGEGEGGDEGGDDAEGVEMRALPCAKESDDQGDAGDGENDGGDFGDRGFLEAAGGHVDQHPDRGGVLHDDGGRYVGALDGDVIKIVGCGDAGEAEEEQASEIGERNAQALPSATREQELEALRGMRTWSGPARGSADLRCGCRSRAAGVR